MKQTRAIVFGQQISSTNATTDMRDSGAARSESFRIPRASGAYTRGWGGPPPGFWRSAVKRPLKALYFLYSITFIQACYSKMKMTPMRPVRQLFKHLTSTTNALVPTEDGLGTSWSFLELVQGGPSPKPGACALPFPRPFITSAACISRDFLTVKRSTLLHSKTCAFRFVILMDRNDSYKQLPDDFRWQGQSRFL